MAPVIHFIRHAQGYHNLSVENQAIHDPLLTPFGKEQCEILSREFPYTSDIDLIVASPLKRTIYTALYSFPSWKETIIALPEVQETSDEPCDTGSSREEIEREFSGVALDLSRVSADWNSKQGRWSPEKSKLEERAQKAREWLQARPEKQIVVVTHGGVLHYLTEDWVGMNHIAGTGWANTEFRSYEFDPRSGGNAKLIETDVSRERRLGHRKPLSHAEKRNLERAHGVKDEQRKGQEAERIAAKRFSAKTLSTDSRGWVGGYGL